MFYIRYAVQNNELEWQQWCSKQSLVLWMTEKLWIEFDNEHLKVHSWCYATLNFCLSSISYHVVWVWGLAPPFHSFSRGLEHSCSSPFHLCSKIIKWSTSVPPDGSGVLRSSALFFLKNPPSPSGPSSLEALRKGMGGVWTDCPALESAARDFVPHPSSPYDRDANRGDDLSPSTPNLLFTYLLCMLCNIKKRFSSRSRNGLNCHIWTRVSPLFCLLHILLQFLISGFPFL